MKKINTEQLAELAMLVEDEDPLDWDVTRIDRHAMYMVSASHIIENFVEKDPNPLTENYITLIASMTYTLVENVYLRERLQNSVDKD